MVFLWRYKPKHNKVFLLIPLHGMHFDFCNF